MIWAAVRAALPGRLLRKAFPAATLATLAMLLCSCSQLVLFNPKGPVGETERFIILTAFALMLVPVLPVIVMAIWFTRRYRSDSGMRPDYAPKWSYSRNIEIAIWVIPAVIVSALVILIWNSTYKLDPHNPIESAEKPVVIEVVSLDWKWLFIYPEENIAVVNQLVFPANVPLAFRLTSDSVMTSFFIPQLGSQIYAMAGMQTRLHLLAREGTYFGHNQQFSGSGYSDMTFKAIAASSEEYSAWLNTMRKAPGVLDLNRYEELAKPTTGYYPVTPFSSVAPGLFDRIVEKYGPHGPHGPPGSQEPEERPGPGDHHAPEGHSRAMAEKYRLKQ